MSGTTPHEHGYDSDISLAKQRYSICLHCENLKPKIKQCDICKCFVYIKVRFNSQKCPIDKW